MNTLDELEAYFKSYGLSETQLLLIGKYVMLYIEELCDSHDIEYSEDELNESSRIITRILLNLIINTSTNNNPIYKNTVNILNDFNTDSKKGVGNLIIPIRIAEDNKEFNTELITKLSEKVIP